MEKKSNESMPKSEEQAAEQMKISMASSIELKRINAVLETLNEGHKLNKVRTFGIYYSDSAILYNKCNKCIFIHDLCAAFAFIGVYTSPSHPVQPL